MHRLRIKVAMLVASLGSVASVAGGSLKVW